MSEKKKPDSELESFDSLGDSLNSSEGDQTTVIATLNELDGPEVDDKKVPVLRVAKGTETGRHYILDAQQNFDIGRSNECDITTPDTSCSRKHAEIFLASNGDIYLKDLKSTNGTSVNGVRITDPRALTIDDLIQVGDNTEFVFESMRHSEAVAQVEIYEKATRDSLTGIYNRQFFEETIARIISQRNEDHSGLGLIIFDIDHFKKVNDTYGHPAGDAVIKEVGHRIPKVVRGDDIFSRIGGEEFALILRSPDEALVAKMAERVRKAVEANPFQTDKGPLDITVSVGSCFIMGKQGVSFTTLYETADKALYEAKGNGRNQSCNKKL
jgi:diguanylate cyclase (GGDEF)-like protein